jgi:molybdenum cofactor cytidylyltransferase
LISGIILAAGSSTRTSGTKQLLPFHGKPILQHVIDAAFQAALDEILVVIGHEHDSLRAAIELPPKARFVLNLDHESGLSTSLVTSLQAADPTCEAAVILMGDQPTLSPAVIRALVATFQETMMPVVRAEFRDGPGPALLSAGIWEDLMTLEGDTGARGFIEANPDLVETVRLDEDAPIDVDSDETYRLLVEAHGGA